SFSSSSSCRAGFSAGWRRRAGRPYAPRRLSSRSELQCDPPSLLGRKIGGIVELRGLIGQSEIGTRLPSDRHAFHEVLNLLQVAARPLLFEADELPARLPVDLLGYVNAHQFLLVGQIARHVVVGGDVRDWRSTAAIVI